MATDLEYLALADLVYERLNGHSGAKLKNIFPDNFTSEKKDTKIRWKTYKNYVDDWRFLEAYDPNNYNQGEEPSLEEKQFYAAAFQSPDGEEIVIAYRGTDGDNGPYDDKWSILGIDISFIKKWVDLDFVQEHGVTNRKIGVATPGRQFGLAVDFYEDIFKRYRNVVEKFSFTGHSLGGGLAQYAAVMSSVEPRFQEPVIVRPDTKLYVDNPKDAVTWNGIGIKCFSRIMGYEFLDNITAFSQRVKDIAGEKLPFGIYEGVAERALKAFEKKGYIKDGKITGDFLDSSGDIDINKIEEVIDGFRFKEDIKDLFRGKGLDIVFSARDGYGVFDSYENIQKKLRTKRYFSNAYGDGEKFNNKITNYIISKDLTSYLAEHIGSTYVVDQGLVPGDSDNFLPNLEMKAFAEYHGLDLFFPYVLLHNDDKKYSLKNVHDREASVGDITDKINYPYLQAVIKAILIDLKDSRLVNNNSLFALYEKYKGNGEEDDLIRVIKGVLKYSEKLNSQHVIIEKTNFLLEKSLDISPIYRDTKEIIDFFREEEKKGIDAFDRYFEMPFEDKEGRPQRFILTRENRLYKLDYAVLEQLNNMGNEEISSLWKWKEEGEDEGCLILGLEEGVDEKRIVDYSLEPDNEKEKLTNENCELNIRFIKRDLTALSNMADIITMVASNKESVQIRKDKNNGIDIYNEQYALIEGVGLKAL